MSHTTKTKIPVAQELLEPQLATEVKQQLEACQQHQAHYYNQGAKPLTALEPHAVVRLRQGKTWTPAIVDAKAETPRSYLVTTETGQQYRRNRKDLVLTGEPPPIISVPEEHTTAITQTSQIPVRDESAPTLFPPVTPPVEQTPTPPPRRSTRVKTAPVVGKWRFWLIHLGNFRKLGQDFLY